jgi:hypothetical protein
MSDEDKTRRKAHRSNALIDTATGQTADPFESAERKMAGIPNVIQALGNTPAALGSYKNGLAVEEVAGAACSGGLAGK